MNFCVISTVPVLFVRVRVKVLLDAYESGESINATVLPEMVVATLEACQGCFHYVKIRCNELICQTEPSVKLIKINGYLLFAHAVLLFLYNLSRWKC